jgi:hypothetical protein
MAEAGEGPSITRLPRRKRWPSHVSHRQPRFPIRYRLRIDGSGSDVSDDHVGEGLLAGNRRSGSGAASACLQQRHHR